MSEMTWNHRVVKRTYSTEKYSEDYFSIHEAYYDENGKIFAITDSGVPPGGESLEDLKWSVEQMKKALDHPVLDYDSIPEEGAINPGDEQQ
jgi:hypothetical protein